MSNLEEDKKAILDNEFLDAPLNKLRLSPGLVHDPKSIVSTGPDAPANPEDGQLWYDTDDTSTIDAATSIVPITPSQFRNTATGNPTTYTDHDMTAHGATAGLTVAVIIMLQFKGVAASDSASFRQNGETVPSLVVYAQSTSVHQSAQGIVGVDANGILEESYTSATDAVTAYVVAVINKVS